MALATWTEEQTSILNDIKRSLGSTAQYKATKAVCVCECGMLVPEQGDTCNECLTMDMYMWVEAI